MKILKIIREEEIFDNIQKKDDSEYTKTRNAVRIIIVDKDGKIALNHYQQNNSYQEEYGIPGGGVKIGEGIMEAVLREAKEETGCDVKFAKEVGLIIEYGVSPNLIQKVYCYTGIIKEKGNPVFTTKELKNELGIKWLSLDDAI
ncbi:MAG: NUDIX hydrolase, partial [Patescibacteria group bacterium]